MGKTRIVQKFLREHRSSFDVTGRTRLPVVAVQMPPAPSERDLYEELLVSMGCVLPAHQGVTTLRQRARVTARQLEVLAISANPLSDQIFEFSKRLNRFLLLWKAHEYEKSRS
jgi:Bacterial TniB protein